MSSSRQFSARFDSDVVNRLERRVEGAAVNRSRLAERYIDEGMRMDDHPGVVFRDGPTGRRTGLAAGPDIWEVIAAIRQSGLTGDAALEAAAQWGGLTPIQMRAAVGYYAEYPEEIDASVRRDIDEADAAEERWRRGLGALA
jgi:hypothetical protein